MPLTHFLENFSPYSQFSLKINFQCYIEFISPEVRASAVKSNSEKKVQGQRIKVQMISHDEMETKVRQHRKFLKQSEFLKRQAAKERQQNAETLKNAQGALIEKVKEKMAETAAETPDEEETNNMDESSSAVNKSSNFQ